VRRASVRARLTAWYGAWLLTTVAGLGAAVDAMTSRTLLRRIDAMLDFEFDEAAERLAAGGPAEEPAGTPAAFHDVYRMRVWTPDDRAAFESPGLAGLPPPRGEGHATIDVPSLGRHRVVAGPVGAGARRRIVQIATPLASFDAEMAALRGVLWTILPAGAVAATAGGWWLAGRAMAPVGRMTAAARRISAENLGERIEVGHEGDELGRLAATLNAMLDRIDRAFAAARRFTADAAHELKTPIASIRAEAEVALIARRTPEEYAETLRSVVEEADRLTRLADRLLILAADDAGATTARRPFPLDEPVRTAVDRAGGRAASAGVALRLGSIPDVEVLGDPELLRQAFDNLIDNAIKYTSAGGEVAVHGGLRDGRAVVEVVDTGPGIPPDALGKVFDRFYRADASRSRRTGGAGLGLSIVKAVVERHGGRAEAESEPGRGSLFRVVLPAAVRKN